MDFPSVSSGIVMAIALLVFAFLPSFVFKWFKTRKHFSRLPGPPHSFWFGHLKAFGDILWELPPNAHPHIATAICAEKYNLGQVFYLDFWPFAQSFLVIADPAIAAQITQVSNLPKHEMEARFLRNVVGERSLVSVNGPEWKALRAVLSPGFSATHLNSMIPRIMKHLRIFKHKLGTAADSQEVIKLQDIAGFATIDVIGEAALGLDLNSQQNQSDIANSFRKIISLSRPAMDLIGTTTNYIPQWWHCQQLDKALRNAIVTRYQNANFDDWGQRAVPDLILQAVRIGKLAQTGFRDISTDHKDSNFMQLAVNNIKGLLLGGHDTSASTFCYVIYLLSQQPECLSALRAEHNASIGEDREAAAEKITSGPHILNQLTYTTSCIRETLRLFPPAATVRASTSETIKTIFYGGRNLPLTGAAIWITQFAMGREAEYWGDPLVFKPDRFRPGYIPEPSRDAFRPFEKGARACIGLELAYIELKIMLVLVARTFDFESAYDACSPRAEERWGGLAYQIMELAPKPAGRMPMRVIKRTQKTC